METPQRLTQLIDWHGSFEEKNKYLLWVENDLSTRTQNLLQLLKDVCAGLFCVTDNEQTMFYKSVFQLILQTQSKELIEFSNIETISTCLASTQNGDNIAWCINSLLSTKLIDITRYKNLFKRVQSFHPDTDKRADVIMGFIFDWFWEKRKPDDTHGASPFQLIVDDFLKTPDSEEYYVGYLLRKFRQRAKYDLPTEHINTWLTDVAYIAENVIWLLSTAFYDLDYAKNIKHGLADNSAKFLENMTSVFGLFNFLEYVCNIKCDNGPLTFYKDSGPFFMDELFVTATRLLVKHDQEFDRIIYSNLKIFRRLRPLWNEQTEDWKQHHFSCLIFRAITDTHDPQCFLYFITQYIAAENLRDLTSEMLKTKQIRDDKLLEGLKRMYQWVKCPLVSLQTDFDHNAPISLTYTIDAYVETGKFQPICRFSEKYFEELENLNQNDQLAVFIQPIERTFSKYHDILLAYKNKHIQLQNLRQNDQFPAFIRPTINILSKHQDMLPDYLNIHNQNRYAGLENHGQTCFMNSALQVLYACRWFRTRLIELDLPQTKGLLVWELQKLFSHLGYGDTPTIYPKSFREALDHKTFPLYQQQDASELIRHVFSRLEGDGYGQLIKDCFSGELISTFKCKSCSYEDSSRETFHDIKLGFPGANSSDTYHLQDMLAYSLRDEDISGQWMCRKCKCIKDCVKTTTCKTVPPYLIITLLRFDYDGHGRRNKIFNETDMPELLQIATLNPVDVADFTATF